MQHFKFLAAGFAMATLFGAQAAPAQSTQGVLVELYTSQGCSSCPPADAILKQLAQDPQIIPLALHVDYWDYIGWKDTFAQEQFSNRQRKYAAHRDDRMVYTPQMIVAGNGRIKGSSGDALRAEIARTHSAVGLNLQRQGDEVVITATPNAALSGQYVVDLVRYRPQSQVLIERGENRGLQAEYHNIVTSWENIGTWNGKGTLNLRARASGAAPVVVVVQRKGPAEVVAAAVLK
jgi:hypothetical protein